MKISLGIGYPIGFIKSVIHDFKKSNEEEQLIIPEWLADQRKALFMLTCCPSNKSVLLIKPNVLPMEN